jgi:hypothetical protein
MRHAPRLSDRLARGNQGVQTRDSPGRDAAARGAVLISAHTRNFRREILMQTRANIAKKVALWVGIIALAIFPFPWWL